MVLKCAYDKAEVRNMTSTLLNHDMQTVSKDMSNHHLSPFISIRLIVSCTGTSNNTYHLDHRDLRYGQETKLLLILYLIEAGGSRFSKSPGIDKTVHVFLTFDFVWL